MNKEIEKVKVYSGGIINCSVCADSSLSPKDVETETNLINPTGLDSKWEISKNKTFRDGEKIPNPCENDSTKQHWLLNC